MLTTKAEPRFRVVGAAEHTKCKGFTSESIRASRARCERWCEEQISAAPGILAACCAYRPDKGTCRFLDVSTHSSILDSLDDALRSTSMPQALVRGLKGSRIAATAWSASWLTVLEPPRVPIKTGFFFEGDGAVVVPGCFDARAVDAHAERVHDYLASDGPLSTHGGLLGHVSGGWYLAGWNTDARLAPLAAMIDGSAALHRRLRSVFGGAGYVGPLSRADMLVDRRSDWHVDKAHSEFAPFMGPHRNPFWRVLADGGTYRIVTVALYLQDHRNDTRALSFRPGGHIGCVAAGSATAGADPLAPPTHGGVRQMCTPKQKGAAAEPRPAAYPLVSLQPRKGDLILFDSRVPHRGQSKQLSQRNHIGRWRGRHRIVATLSYGAAANAYTAAYDRAFAWRNTFFNNASLQRSNVSARQALVRRELEARPPSRALTSTWMYVPRTLS